jgi:hypothetical protein
MEEYGMPTWGSYLIFAIATIIIGALLGLVSFFPSLKSSVMLRLLHAVDTFLLFQVLVCLIDFIYPPKPVPVETRKETKLEKEKGEEENHGKQASGDELVRIILIFLYSSLVIPCFLTVHKGTDVWISDFKE